MNDSCCYPRSLIDVFPFYCFLPLPSSKIYPVTHANELGEIHNEGEGGTVHKYSQSQSNNLRFIFPLKKQTTFPDHFQIHSLILYETQYYFSGRGGEPAKKQQFKVRK